MSAAADDPTRRDRDAAPLAEADAEAEAARPDERDSRASGRRRVRVRRSWASRISSQLEDWPVETIVKVLVAAIALGATLAVGAVHPPVLLVIGLVAAAALAGA